MNDSAHPPFAFLQPGDPFPDLGSVSEALGPLAVGGDLSPSTLFAAYSRGIFPWYSTPPILWWSTNPRMVLPPRDFRLHPSLRKTIQKLFKQGRLEVKVDHAFSTVLRHCARIYRPGQSGTWIVPQMQAAYLAFHEAGHVHSVETWLDGELAGGLYFVNIGKAVFGESMFSLKPDASKIALAGLVAMCRAFEIPIIDCQQNTDHLASLGAAEMDRDAFIASLRQSTLAPTPHWSMQSAYWTQLDSRLGPAAAPSPSP